MARRIGRLSARKVVTLSSPGRHADGGGLYLKIGPGASRRWVFIFRWRGKLAEMGLGSLASVSLANARKRASEARRVVADGKNPIFERRQAEARQMTFGSFADSLVEEIGPGFRNAKHRAQWT